MKYIVAIIQPQRLEAVKDSLAKVGVQGLTVTDSQGIGRQKGHTEYYRGHEYQVNLLRKVKLEVAVGDEKVASVVEAISSAARSGDEGKIGDGKIFILPLGDAVRIRTGERGGDAL